MPPVHVPLHSAAIFPLKIAALFEFSEKSPFLSLLYFAHLYTLSTCLHVSLNVTLKQGRVFHLRAPWYQVEWDNNLPSLRGNTPVIKLSNESCLFFSSFKQHWINFVLPYSSWRLFHTGAFWLVCAVGFSSFLMIQSL